MEEADKPHCKGTFKQQWEYLWPFFSNINKINRPTICRFQTYYLKSLMFFPMVFFLLS